MFLKTVSHAEIFSAPLRTVNTMHVYDLHVVHLARVYLARGVPIRQPADGMTHGFSNI